MTRPLQRPLYDNIVVLSPDNQPLCRCNKDKANWYLTHNLAEIVQTDPLFIKLKFTPKGMGHCGDSFYMAEKRNLCVVCGTTEDHTRHHIVPYCFRRYFPDRIKRHNSHDIVPLCVACHDSYETQADVLKNALGAEYGVPFTGKHCHLDKNLYTVKRHASALKSYRDRIPNDRIEHLYNSLRNHFGKREITDEDIAQAAKIKPFVKSEQAMKYGQAIVAKVTDLQAFVVRWRKHFLSTMMPKHMPTHWSVDRNLQGVD